MSTSTLSGHRDIILGAFFSNTNQQAYTVARDGAVFTWSYDEIISDGIELEEKDAKKKKKNRYLKNKNSHDDEIHEIREDGNDDEEDSSDDSDDDEGVDPSVGKIVQKKMKWALREREFLWDPQTIVSSVDFNKLTQLLVVGFSSGVFGLYEMPGCINLHRLSISTHTITSVSINSTGEWLAIGSSQLGQLLVWEWKSESFVLKQQGHLYGLNTIDYSSDGQFIATGGEDGKVKLWNTISGFCFITFSEHIAPVTGVKFVGKGLGKAIISSSLDGTIRAHDLLRYRNFRTLTTPEPVQFTCLAVDSSGEVVCAGALDPFNIYVWALQTGA
jgi:periodic tryptophan protein 2